MKVVPVSKTVLRIKPRFIKKSNIVVLPQKNDILLTISICSQLRFRESLDHDKKPCFITTRMISLNSIPYKKNNLKCLDKFHLSFGSKIIANEPNAGGNSVISEVLSFEILHRLFCAKFEFSEMQLIYWPPESKKTDYSVYIQDHRLGVSVSRAMNFIDDNLFTSEDSIKLLSKKLKGILYSSKNIIERQKWKRQILHIWTRSELIAKKLQICYKQLKSSIRSNTIVVVTVAPNCDFIF